ncbi:MmgE/PrpD family protein [Paraburkholderia sp. ZP32-5]|uniref:MmgE/PrpD family protein n=1 Tax=Paraburkholderia sp. ZP32-5 TaxID=2883245 RepID=UPI001F168FCD|nr:MmgE/PrpD family protein [Paraburkholderia sp. ZP32-5]
MNESISNRLAQFAATLEWKNIPADVREQVRLRVLDTTGLIVVGANTQAVRAAEAFARDYGASIGGIGGSGPGSTVIGSRTVVPPSIAALVHGVSSHCRDFDDTFVDSVVHTGSVVMPVALAMAEALDATPEDFGAAVVAGYEIAARIGGAAGRKFHEHNLHATGIVGPLAAAVTAGRLMRLSAGQISSSLGLAASMSGGLMAFTVDGGWSKWLHAGWAAHGGIVAASMAKRGFQGPAFAIEGPKGLYGALLHGESIDLSNLTESLGTLWPGAASEFKYYPCAHVTHPYIDAVLDLMKRHGLTADDIERIDCYIAPWAAAIVAEPRESRLRFETELEAIASLPYQLAVAAVDRQVGLKALDADQRSRADLSAMAQRIFHVTDPALGRGFDGSVELFTRGARYVQNVVMPGSDINRLTQKFVDNVQPVFDRINPDDGTVVYPRGGQIDAASAARLILDGGWQAVPYILQAISPG